LLAEKDAGSLQIKIDGARGEAPFRDKVSSVFLERTIEAGSL
jgi:hypothetical protein